ncbi:MAG: hypothetical protein ABIP95_08540 [Pelobium sp.]
MKNIKFLSLAALAVVLSSACKKDDSSGSGGCSKCEVAYKAQDIKATVDAKTAGKFTGLTFQYAKPGSTIKDGTKADFELTTNGELIVKIEGMDCVTLVNPTFAQQGSTELRFTDNCKTMLMYAVSFGADGKLNEVNSGSVSGTYYGQFHQ